MISLYHTPSVLSHVLRDIYRDLESLDRTISPYWNSSDPLENNVGQMIGEITDTAEKFAVSLDVSHFKPSELKVELDGNQLCIEGEQEIKTEHGYSKRSFIRSFILPQGIDMSAVRSSLTDNGHLCIEAPKKTFDETKRINIPIQAAIKQ